MLTTAPPRPSRLTGAAGELWDRLAPKLVAMKVLATIDLEALSVLCDRWEEYLDAKKEAEKEPYFTTDKGYVAEHPAVRRMHTAASALMDLWAKFGLTPLSRMQLDPEMDNEDTGDLAEFAAKKNG